jgi:hypothetical protein
MNSYIVIDGSNKSNNSNFVYTLPQTIFVSKIALLSAQINAPYSTINGELENCRLRIGIGPNINSLSYTNVDLPTSSYADTQSFGLAIASAMNSAGISSVSCSGDNNTLKLTFSKTNDGNILYINSNPVENSNIPRITGLVGGNISTYEFTCNSGGTIVGIKPVDLINERILYINLGSQLPANNILFENGMISTHFIIPMTSSRGSLLAANSSFQNILDYGENVFKVTQFEVKLLDKFGQTVNSNLGPLILILQYA